MSVTSAAVSHGTARRFRYLAVVVCLIGVLAWYLDVFEWLRLGATVPQPEQGAVSNGTYANKYFDLSYPLPKGWTEGLAGPGPSQSAYYVLDTFVPAGEITGTVLVAAQDSFFAAKDFSDAKDMAREFSRAMGAIEGMNVDRQPSEVTIAGRLFSRFDFSGVGLYRSTWVTGIRCHFVSFNLTANSPERLAEMVSSLNSVAYAGDRNAGRVDPVCIKNYATPENLVAKVDPPAVGPTFTPIPVRMIISPDGNVKHVHVIRATDEQRSSVENALGRWKFKPSQMQGRAAEVETGVLLEFRPSGVVVYKGGA